MIEGEDFIAVFAVLLRDLMSAFEHNFEVLGVGSVIANSGLQKFLNKEKIPSELAPVGVGFLFNRIKQSDVGVYF